MSKRVFLGMSGGVDSSVSAILLKEQGYDVTGVYMKNWSKDLPGMKCPWAEDLADAKRVAVRLDLDFEVWDFETEYKQKVVDYMLSEFQKGRTPNPDVICNELIKFKLFAERAFAAGADYIATGHYARVGDLARRASLDPQAPPEPKPSRTHQAPSENPSETALLRARDENKDQTYFLYRMSDSATARTLFPVGDLLKPEVKRIAAEHDLDVATKKESMGVCFVGEVGMKDFLREYLDARPGEIREQETDRVLGYHDGAIFYTLGQRHGLYLGGGLPFYVVGKDLGRNLVYVSKNLNHPSLWADQLKLEDLHLRNSLTLADLVNLSDAKPGSSLAPLQVRLRHRAPLIDCQIKLDSDDSTDSIARRSSNNHQASNNHHVSGAAVKSASQLIFSRPIKRPAPGQSAVLYMGDVCLGGGVIAE